MAFNFATPQWDSNITADKANKVLFNVKESKQKQLTKVLKQHQNKQTCISKNIHNEINKKALRKKKHILKGSTNNLKSNVSHKPIQNELLFPAKNTNVVNILEKKNKELKIRHTIKKEKQKVKHSNRNKDINVPANLKRPKHINKLEAKSKRDFTSKASAMFQSQKHVFGISRKQNSTMSLRERMFEKLNAARFRYLNEQMYTTAGIESKKYFEQHPNDFEAYHEGYRQQVSRWPLNPLDIIIAKIKKMPKNYIIADFGCGEAKLAKSITQVVHSFDLIAVDDSIIACDMCKVPLPNNSVDVVVFCLSLMGTNLKEYLHEAARVLKAGGMMKIAEVESRFNNIDTFVEDIQKFGFVLTDKDLSHDLFWFLDFIKKASNIPHKLPNIHLKPCLYKRR